VEDIGQFGHLSEEDQGYRQQLGIHLEHILAGGLKPKDVAEQLIREMAFTHLNRLCAYRLMEARGLIRESVSRCVKSQGGFLLPCRSPGGRGVGQSQ
jgi:3-methyladenine DNA glycosylase Tag